MPLQTDVAHWVFKLFIYNYECNIVFRRCFKPIDCCNFLPCQTQKPNLKALPWHQIKNCVIVALNCRKQTIIHRRGPERCHHWGNVFSIWRITIDHTANTRGSNSYMVTSPTDLLLLQQKGKKKSHFLDCL